MFLTHQTELDLCTARCNMKNIWFFFQQSVSVMLRRHVQVVLRST